MLVRAVGTPFGDHGENPGLFGLKATEKLFKSSSKVLIGHNRSGTRGEISTLNAHPFKFTNIVGAHNGTIAFATVSNLLGHNVYDTDSEALFNTIQQKGIEETVKTINSIGAIVWYDNRDDTLNFYRDKERPLHYIFSEDMKNMFWSSDASPLFYALHRQKVSIIKDAKAMMVPENTWLSWKLPGSCQKFSDPIRKTIEPLPFGQTSWVNKGRHSSFPIIGGERYDDDEYWYREAGYTYNWTLRYWQQGTRIAYYPAPEHAGPGDIGSVQVYLLPNKVEETKIPLLEGVIEDKPKNNVVIVRERIEQARRDREEAQNRATIVKKMADANREKFFKQFPDVTTNPELVIKYINACNRVYYNNKKQEWLWYELNIPTDKFIERKMPHAPQCVPFTKINVESGGSHLFKYNQVKTQGKKERVIMYKGFEKDLLVQHTFNGLMAQGCMNCQRTPEWGNRVRFFNHTDFLCEFCSEMPEVVKLVGECN